MPATRLALSENGQPTIRSSLFLFSACPAHCSSHPPRPFLCFRLLPSPLFSLKASWMCSMGILEALPPSR